MKNFNLLSLTFIMAIGTASASDFCEFKTFKNFNPATRTHTDEYVAVCTDDNDSFHITFDYSTRAQELGTKAYLNAKQKLRDSSYTFSHCRVPECDKGEIWNR